MIQFKEAQKLAKELGYNLTFNRDFEEYRAAPIKGSEKKIEAQAVYGDDLDDVVGSMKADAARAAELAAKKQSKEVSVIAQFVDALREQISLDSEWARVDPVGFAERKDKADKKAKALIAKYSNA